MISFRKLVSILRNPFKWYYQQTAHIEEEARKATRQVLQKETDALIAECTELESLIEDNPYGLPALDTFSGEDDNRFKDRAYFNNAVERFNAFQVRITTNDGLYRHHAGDKAVDEWQRLHARFRSIAESYRAREEERRQRELE